MTAWPLVPVPPVRLHPTEGGLLVVGVDGDLVWLDAETLAPRDEPVQPFPSRIVRSAVDGGVLLGGWIDHEIGVARLAALELATPFSAGVHRSKVRSSLGVGGGPRPHVAGARWSHELQAEPLAVCAGEGGLGFALHTRGVYAVDTDANEHWRRPLPAWSALPDLPDADVLVDLVVVDGTLWLWSLAGGWQRWGWQDGEEQARGVVTLPDRLERVAHHPALGWLLICRGGALMAWDEDTGAQSGSAGGPVQAAVGSADGWRIAGWRRDVHWRPGSEPVSTPRAELGAAIWEHPTAGWLVLDNIGAWSAFGTGA